MLSSLPARGTPLDLCCMHVQINNGVYRSGFATTQGAYERAQNDLYTALDTVEQRLSQHRFLVGDRYAAPAHLTAAASSVSSLILLCGPALALA